MFNRIHILCICSKCKWMLFFVYIRGSIHIKQNRLEFCLQKNKKNKRKSEENKHSEYARAKQMWYLFVHIVNNVNVMGFYFSYVVKPKYLASTIYDMNIVYSHKVTSERICMKHEYMCLITHSWQWMNWTIHFCFGKIEF